MTHIPRPPALSAPKGESKFEILIVKIFNLKPKPNLVLPSTIENQILPLQENSLRLL